MKKLIKLVVIMSISVLMIGCSKNSNNLTGAGSSFIYPALSIWARDYAQQIGTKINYQAIGSGGGLQQLYSHTVDFAASDMPLTLKDLKKHQLQQFPIITGGIVMAINIPGVKTNTLTLSGPVLEKIYMGGIKYWDNTQIKNLNPKLNLPHHIIIAVHRADGSGTTFNFTNYLSKINADWRSNIGANTIVAWPGDGIGAKGNAGVAAQIMQTQYAIGYVGFAYALQNHMIIIKMKNQDGRVVIATNTSFAAAAKNAKWHAGNGFYSILTNQSGAKSWPIVATTFILVPQKARTPKIKKQVFKFFEWCYKNGTTSATRLDFVTIPPAVYENIIKTFK